METTDMTIAKWGNSLGLRIPGPIAKSLGLSEGSSVRLSASRGRLTIEPVAPQAYDLNDLLKGVTPQNCHGSIETGNPEGDEIW